MEMEFLKDLQEARMTRNSSNAKVLTYTDCKERLYLTLLVVDLLRKYPDSKVAARAYATKTTQTDNYKHFRMNGTDLANLIYFVDGDDDAQDKLKDPGAAKRMRKQTTLPTMAVNRFLTRIAAGSDVNGSALFIKLEGALSINNADYKFIRRILSNYNNSRTIDKKTAVSKLILAARAKLRNHDLIDDLQKVSVEKDLEIGVADNEPTVSTPDVPTEGLSMVNYRYLVGTENIWLAKKFVEMSTQSKSVPANIIRGYLPVIKMVTEIVQAGPAYIQMLRTVHQRAKKNLK